MLLPANETAPLLELAAVIDSVSPSTSESFAKTFTTTCVSSVVLAESACATGAS